MSGEGRDRQAIRKLAPGKLVIASHNEGKVREIGELLAPYGIETVSAKKLGLPEPDETGTTFVANAELKAQAAADLSGLPALADDSGLCVAALNGEPGISSHGCERRGSRLFRPTAGSVNAFASPSNPGANSRQRPSRPACAKTEAGRLGDSLRPTAL